MFVVMMMVGNINCASKSIPYTDGDLQSLRTMVESAVNDDVITIDDGAWMTGCDVIIDVPVGITVTIRGVSTSGTIINCINDSSTSVLFNITQSTLVLEDMTILGVYTVIKAKDATLTVRNVVISDIRGIGVDVTDGSVQLSQCVFSHCIDSAVSLYQGTATVNDCLFSNNSSPSLGGCIRAGQFSTIDISHCKFTDSIAEEGGAVYSYYANVYMFNVTADACSSRDKGGAFSLKAGTSMVIVLDGVVVTNCSSSVAGGAAYVVNKAETTFVMRNSMLLGNHAPEVSAIWMFYGAMDLHNVTFLQNNSPSTSDAPALRLSASTAPVVLSCNYCHFIDNVGNYTCAFKSDSNLIATFFNNTSFIGNRGHRRGAVRIYSAISVVFEDVLFKDNTNNVNGGAVDIGSSSNITFRRCLFSNNTVTMTEALGGAIDILSSSVFIEHSRFFSNFAYESGGAIMMYDSNLTVTNTTMSGCTAISSSGGCIRQRNGRLIVTSSTFDDSNAMSHGGCIKATGGVVEMFNTTFFNCSSVDGGAIYTESHTVITLDCVVIHDCNADDDGGGIHATASNTTIRRSVLRHNTGHGTGVGGALVLDESGVLEMYDTIIEHNSAYAGSAVHFKGNLTWAYFENVTITNNYGVSAVDFDEPYQTNNITFVNSRISYNEMDGIRRLRDTLYLYNTVIEQNRQIGVVCTTGGSIVMDAGSKLCRNFVRQISDCQSCSGGTLCGTIVSVDWPDADSDIILGGVSVIMTMLSDWRSNDSDTLLEARFASVSTTAFSVIDTTTVNVTAPCRSGPEVGPISILSADGILSVSPMDYNHICSSPSNFTATITSPPVPGGLPINIGVAWPVTFTIDTDATYPLVVRCVFGDAQSQLAGVTGNKIRCVPPPSNTVKTVNVSVHVITGEQTFIVANTTTLLQFVYHELPVATSVDISHVHSGFTNITLCGLNIIDYSWAVPECSAMYAPLTSRGTFVQSNAMTCIMCTYIGTDDCTVSSHTMRLSYYSSLYGPWTSFEITESCLPQCNGTLVPSSIKSSVQMSYVPVTVYGDNFIESSSASCRFNGTLTTYQYISSTRCQCSIPFVEIMGSYALDITMNMQQWVYVGDVTITPGEPCDAGHEYDGTQCVQCRAGMI